MGMFFFFNDTATTEIYTLSLHDALPISFLAREYDVLVCTTIIETGMDIANANTMIIYDADKMGLSQLYQLRGRVGRSNKQGRSEEHTSELQSRQYLVCRLLLEKKNYLSL